MEQLMIDSNQYVAFRLNTEIYAVDIRIVKTVEKVVPITRVPKVAHHFKGVINLRGEIIPVIDLRKRFNMVISEETEDTRIMVLKFEDIQVGILVDCVEEVINIPPTCMENANSVNSAISGSYVLGLGKVGNRIITILNFEKLAKEEDS